LNYVDRIKTVCLRGLINLGVGGWALSQSLIGLIRGIRSRSRSRWWLQGFKRVENVKCVKGGREEEMKDFLLMQQAHTGKMLKEVVTFHSSKKNDS
jgi:hypothetical protein